LIDKKQNNLNKKALGLFSAGLDSWLSAMLVMQQGFEVYLLHFVSPLFGYKDDKLNKIKKMAEAKGMHFIIYNVGNDYVEDVVRNPKHGIGSAFNSCLDCHRYMLQKAKKIMKEIGAEFVFSGEVLAQRPMSQRREALDIVEKESGLEGLLLRPLSAKLLAETIVEKKGLVDRKQLLSIHGRGRSEQIKLAKAFNLQKMPQSSGGCKFTDKNTRSRFISIRDINKNLTWEDLELVTIGRHFNLGDGYYLILARDFQECNKLLEYKAKGIFIEAKNLGGAKAILINYSLNDSKDSKDKEKEIISASIVARYTKIPEHHQGSIDIVFHYLQTKSLILKVMPMSEDQIKEYLVI
jgi:tRNA-uridine 2-sulfurtransferase